MKLNNVNYFINILGIYLLLLKYLKIKKQKIESEFKQSYFEK